jgi:hypothetical protein
MTQYVALPGHAENQLVIFSHFRAHRKKPMMVRLSHSRSDGRPAPRR